MQTYTILDPADGSGVFYAWHGASTVDVYRHTEPDLQPGELFLPGWPAEQEALITVDLPTSTDGAPRREAVASIVEAWHRTERSAGATS